MHGTSPATVHSFLRYQRGRTAYTFFTNTHSYNCHLHSSFCKHFEALSIPPAFFHNSALTIRHRTPSFIPSLTVRSVILFCSMRDSHDTWASWPPCTESSALPTRATKKTIFFLTPETQKFLPSVNHAHVPSSRVRSHPNANQNQSNTVRQPAIAPNSQFLRASMSMSMRIRSAPAAAERTGASNSGGDMLRDHFLEERGAHGQPARPPALARQLSSINAHIGEYGRGLGGPHAALPCPALPWRRPRARLAAPLCLPPSLALPSLPFPFALRTPDACAHPPPAALLHIP